MIIGVGTDLCDIRRIERVLARHGDRFIQRVYAEVERSKAARRPNPAAVFAQCFAAKEACTKALGTGLRQGVFFRDIVVGNLPSGQPVLALRGGAERRMSNLTPPGMRARIDVSLTDEYPLAHAIVVISGWPEEA